MRSLQQMRDLPLGFLFPAHGPPVATARRKIDFYIEHRKAREEAIYAALDDGPLRPAAIVPKVYIDLDPRSVPLAEINVFAHLERLEEHRRVSRKGDTFFQS